MIQIRKATLKDIAELAELFDAYRMFYKQNTALEEAKQFLTARIQHTESVVFVAEKENTLLGFVQLYPIFSSTRMKSLWLLNDLYVNSNDRGQGIGIQLMKRSQQHAIDTECCGLILETEKTNTIGNGLYPKMGFTLNTAHNFYEWDA